MYFPFKKLSVLLVLLFLTECDSADTMHEMFPTQEKRQLQILECSNYISVSYLLADEVGEMNNSGTSMLNSVAFRQYLSRKSGSCQLASGFLTHYLTVFSH